MKNSTKGALVVLGCLSLPVVMVVSAVWGGIGLSVVWNWFMPTIFGLPRLGVVQAMAATLVISYLTKAHVPPKEEEDAINALIKALLTAFLTPLFLMGIGFVLKLFI